MDDLVPGVRRIKGPPITPPHVEDPVLSVEIATDLMFFRGVFRVASMFPGGSEGFELINGDLSIRSISSLLRVI